MRRASLFLVLVGCSSSTPAPPVDAGSDTSVVVDAPPADARAAACTLTKAYSSKDVDCNACAERECCDEVNACFSDKRCDDDYVNCILGCALLPADAADAGAERDRCVAECDATHPEGKKLYDAAIGCADTRCKTECQ